MKTGDPKQARILAFVAALAIGFFVYRMLPIGGAEPVQALRDSESPSAVTQNGPLPDRLTTDPFFHPRLETANRSQADPESQPENARPNPAPAPIGPLIPWVGELPAIQPEPTQPDPTAVKPAETPAFGQKSGQTQPVEQPLMVKAIIKSGKPRAVVSINGSQKTVYVGDSLGEGVVVQRITDIEVVVKTPNGEKSLKVGK